MFIKYTHNSSNLSFLLLFCFMVNDGDLIQYSVITESMIVWFVMLGYKMWVVISNGSFLSSESCIGCV